MPDGISIIIVSYEVRSLLKACLASIVQQETSGFSVETIVIDNASSDGSAEMVQAEFPAVRLIANTANEGFSQANNQGMELAGGNYIFLLNPDTELQAGSLQKLFDFAQTQQTLFLAGPQLLNSDGSLQVSAWKTPVVSAMIAEALFLHRVFGVSEYPKEQFATAFSPGMLSGAALFFPRRLFETIGGLDPQLFWMEDADFSFRAKKSGAALIYFPDAKVIHHSGQSSKKNQRIVVSNQLLSKLKYYKKHLSGFSVATGVFFCFIHICSRIFLFSLFAVFSRNARMKASAYLFTFRKFFRYLFSSDNSVT